MTNGVSASSMCSVNVNQYPLGFTCLFILLHRCSISYGKTQYTRLMDSCYYCDAVPGRLPFLLSLLAYTYKYFPVMKNLSFTCDVYLLITKQKSVTRNVSCNITEYVKVHACVTYTNITLIKRYGYVIFKHNVTSSRHYNI